MANNNKKVPQLTKTQRNELAKKLHGISASMKSKTVYRVRYGIDDGITKSNAETGRLFGISGEAVRQLIVEIEKSFIK